MKWIDENGNTLEGTVDEYKAYKSLYVLEKKQPVQPVIEQPEIMRQRRFHHRKRWSDEDIKNLREHYINYARGIMTAKELLKYFPDRSLSQVRAMAHYYLKINIHKVRRMDKDAGIIFKTIKARKKVKYNPDNRNIERMRFIGKRASHYMRLYKWSRNRACEQASLDWARDKRPLGTVTEAVSSTVGTVLSTEKKPLYKLYALHIKEKDIRLVNVFTILEDAQKAKVDAEALGEIGILYYIEQEV